MFGYVRPEKPDLLVREFTRYRSVYCGLCKQIARDYGQLPRLATGYDLTFLALLLLGLSGEEVPIDVEGCVLNPLGRNPVLRGGQALSYVAALSVMLAYRKADDDVRDMRSPKGWAARATFARANRRADRRFPEAAAAIAAGLAELAEAEKGPPDPEAAGIFGRLLGALFAIGTDRCVPPPAADEPSALPHAALRAAMARLGEATGRWIFLLDAFDDAARDEDNGAWNALSGIPADRRRETAEALLVAAEEDADRTAALLPYRRDAGIAGNVIRAGWPGVRADVFDGRRLRRL